MVMPPDGRVITDLTGWMKLNWLALPSFRDWLYFEVSSLVMVGPCGHLDPVQPFDVEIAFPARHQQAHGITLFGTNALAILEQRQNALLMRFLERDGTRQAGGIAAFRQNPFAFGLNARFVQQQAQLHAGPFAARQKAVNAAGVSLRRLGPGIGAAVAAAFHEMHAADARIAQQSVHGEFQRLVHQAVDQKLVRGGIDVGHAIVMALVMQPVGRDDAFQAFQRRVRRAGARRNPRRPRNALHLGFMRRRHAIGGKGLARRGHGGRDVFVGLTGRERRLRRRRAGQRGLEEFAACGLGHARDFRIPFGVFQACEIQPARVPFHGVNIRETCVVVIFHDA